LTLKKMKFNQSAIASIALLSFFSSVMADDEPTVTEMVSGGVSQNIGPDGLTTVTIRNRNPDGSISTTIRVEEPESTTPATGYESQPESTKTGYETETIDNAGFKLSFSMLSGLVALFAI
jgi:hypothetical protein